MGAALVRAIKGIRIPESGTIFACKICESEKFECRKPESWALESGKQLKESRIPLTIGILSPSFTDKESGIQYPVIHGEESSFSSSLGSLTWGDLIQAVLK